MRFLIAEVFLCSFFVLQLAHQKIFRAEEKDRAIDILLTIPLSYSVIYLVKVTSSLVLSSLVIFPFVFFMELLHGVNLFDGFFIGIIFLMNFGLSALGVLLSQITGKASGRDLIFPLLYFPMTVPVLLASVQASFSHFGVQSLDGVDLWFGLLCVFCIIYLTLGILLFEELVSLD